MKKIELSHPDHVFLLGVIVTVAIGMIHLGQRLGDWRSKIVARIMGGLAMILLACWVYLACLWLFEIDMRPWFTGHWLLIFLLLLGGGAIVWVIFRQNFDFSKPDHETFTWPGPDGQIRHKCPHCPFDTYDERLFREHLQWNHRTP
jgi:hypothetical protein